MTAKQFQKLAKTLLPALPGYAVGSKMVIQIAPGRFLVRILFGKHFGRYYFHLWAFVLPLFPSRDVVSLNYGKRIGDALNWRLDIPALLLDLIAATTTDGLPFLDAVSTGRGFLNYLKDDIDLDRQRVNPHTLETLAYTLIKTGDYTSGLKALVELKLRFENATTPWVLELNKGAMLVEEKLLQNPETALAQLEVWKSETKSKLKLGMYF